MISNPVGKNIKYSGIRYKNTSCPLKIYNKNEHLYGTAEIIVLPEAAHNLTNKQNKSKNKQANSNQ